MTKAATTLPQTWLCCNCCSCRRLLSGLACADALLMMPWNKRRGYPSLVAGRIHGRPYCAACLATAVVVGSSLGLAPSALLGQAAPTGTLAGRANP